MSFAQFFRRFFHRETNASWEARLKTLENRWNVIETEWTEWYEKFRLLHLRLAKRQKAIEAAEAAESVEPDNTTLTAPNGGAISGPPSSGLTDLQKEAQQQILRRRARI